MANVFYRFQCLRDVDKVYIGKKVEKNFIVGWGFKTLCIYCKQYDEYNNKIWTLSLWEINLVAISRQTTDFLLSIEVMSQLKLIQSS